jgi:hypothetical protein
MQLTALDTVYPIEMITTQRTGLAGLAASEKHVSPP